MPHLGLLASIPSLAFLKCSVVALASIYMCYSQLRAYGFGGLRPSYQLWNLLQLVRQGSPFFLNSPQLRVSVLQHAVLSSCLCSLPELLAHFFLLNVTSQPPFCRLQQVSMHLLPYLHPALSDMHAGRLEALEAACGAGVIVHSLPLSQRPGHYCERFVRTLSQVLFYSCFHL